MRYWLSQGGAWETDLAEDLAIAPKTDNTVMSPNGNRLMRQDRMVEPTWLQPNEEHICGGLRETSTLGVVFVGDADLSPGVDYGQVYARLSKAYMSVFAELGVPLVNQAPGLELQDDGIHWKVSSHEAVLALVDVLIREPAPTANFRVCPPAPLWQWRFNPAHGRHYPECKKCGKLATDDNLYSRLHNDTCGGNLTGFMFADRASLFYNGLHFKLDNGTIDTMPFIPADRPLQDLRGEVPVETPPNNPIVSFEIVEHLSKKYLSNTFFARDDEGQNSLDRGHSRRGSFRNSCFW